ncbi:MAG: prolipoprotein diacylglyceryl transferase [Gemmatimonadota bacterium]|nr:prolipoprotein diacylglyceryl transferase [Gemmatimonadota bacterium]
MYPNLFRLPEWFPFLGGEPITSFGVMMLLSFLTAGYVLRAEMARMKMDPEQAWDLLFMAVVGGILGAKIYYVLLNYPRLVADPIGMIFSRGGMVWYGGFILAATLVLWKARQLGLPLTKILDGSAPALALAYAVGRVGCFLVGDDYGRPTDSWVGIAFPNGTPPTRVDVLESQFGVTVDPALVEKYGQVIPVHPTQLYEIGLSTLFFFILWRMRRHPHQSGWLFSIWLILAGFERFAVEFFRAKDDRFFGMFTLAQMISLALVATGAYWALRLRRTTARA